MDLKLLEKQVIDTCPGVAAFIADNLGKVAKAQIEEKELNSLVSYVDKSAEKTLVNELGKILPEATFITEENTISQKTSDLNWIIDPLDGTNNFLHEIPHFSISIALQYKSEIVLGIVYDVMRNECFHATKGGGAFLNDTSISVSKSNHISRALFATGFPYTNDYDSQSLVHTLLYFLKNSRGIRRFGSAALDLAYVACGKFDGYYETRLNTWDIAAGSLLVQEAGGKTSDFSGNDNDLSGNQILATNGDLHNQVIKVLTDQGPQVVHHN